MVAPPIAVGHPEPVIVERVTRGGRRLWYHLEVIQQPERARACGAGPKSSADRRPVDPPPVVELRIFEGPSIEHAKDITFTYNANFFLFATLEHARVLAHGRVQAPSAATPPVLTGMPVSGMAYLDRPKEAGYFLFPDLSVRHEGRYRLTFNLFEQTKETADLDKEMNDGSAAHTPESFDWRMEVKSNDFMVFSAKKFPGLTESTALSRTVAEQGCRVRIRRDVRMRRREGKSAAAAAAAGSGDVRAEEEYARRHRTQTPEVGGDYRARSLSTESVNRTPYAPDVAHPQRRPSMTDYHHTAPSPQPGPSMPPAFGSTSGQQLPNNSTHLRFGGGQPPSYAQSPSVPPSPTYTASSHSYTQPPQPQQQPQHPQHAQHHSSSSFSAPSPSPQAPPSSHAYYQDRPASQHYSAAPTPISVAAPSPVSAAPSPKRESFSEYRRMSASYPPPLSAEIAADRRSDLSRPIPPMVSPSENKTMTLPPLSQMISSMRDEKSQLPPSSSTTSPNSDRVPSLSQLLLPQPVLPPPSSSSMANKKRSYGQYNNMDSVAEAYVANTSVKNHARQTETPRDYDELWWKRADGSVWTAHGEVTQQRA